MICPACKNVNLVMSDRSGIEIDYCPSCRGVWLDRGELDKIIERSAQMPQPQAAPPPPQPAPYAPPPPSYPAPQYRHDDRDYYKKKKHKSWLEDIFD